jgi:hypothetical protein
MAHIERKKAKGLPKRYGNNARKARRMRYFLKHKKSYTGR